MFFCAEEEIVRIVNEAPMKLWRVADNPSDDTGIFLIILLPREANSLIFEYIVCSVENTLAIDNLLYRLALFPDDKESSERIDSIESGKVKIASVKHIARQRLVCEPVHRVDIMYVGVGDSVEHRNLRDDLYDFLNLPEGQWLKIIKKRSPEEDISPQSELFPKEEGPNFENCKTKAYLQAI